MYFHKGNYSNTLPTVPTRPYSFKRARSLFLLSHALYFASRVSVLSVCLHRPVLVVMILSVHLVSCQTHRIYSGLFPMLTLMFLFCFTREEGKWLVERAA